MSRRKPNMTKKTAGVHDVAELCGVSIFILMVCARRQMNTEEKMIVVVHQHNAKPSLKVH